MADPVLTVAERLRPTFAKIAGGHESDPMVRRSDRADAQVNGSLALAKVLNKTLREVAQMVLDAADLSAVCSATEIAGPGLINITFSSSFLASELVVAAAGSRLTAKPSPLPATTCQGSKVIPSYRRLRDTSIGQPEQLVLGRAVKHSD